MKGRFSFKIKAVLAASAVGIILCAILLIPQFRILVVKLVEKSIVRRPLRDYDKWMQILFYILSIGAGVFTFNFCALLVYVCVPLQRTLIKVNSYINYKEFYKPVLFLFVVYTIGIISIIRADFLYRDDIGRSIWGYRGWNDFSRYISNFLSIFIHADIHINDISPLPQLIAAFFLAIAGVIICFVISSEHKTSKRVLLASLPAGLSPYFLECFSYKFDSPYTAMSILASVVPFLFIKNYMVYAVISFISILIMCMTYQASSGIYIIIVVLLCFQDWNCHRKANKELLLFAGISAAAYCAAMIVFRLVIMRPINPVYTYVSLSMYPVKDLFPGGAHNFILYAKTILSDFGIIWKTLIALLFIVFCVKSAMFTKRNKILSCICSIIVLFLLCVLSFGVYLILYKPLYSPRAMYGFGVLIAMICIYIVSSQKKIFAVPVFALCWCFFVFAFSYGNALSDQKRYNNFRTEILLHDLSILFPSHSGNPLPISLQRQAEPDYTPVIKNIASRNPIINRLMVQDFWINIYMMEYYKFNPHQEGVNDIGLNVILDSYYHTIKSDGERVLVILK